MKWLKNCPKKIVLEGVGKFSNILIFYLDFWIFSLTFPRHSWKSLTHFHNVWKMELFFQDLSCLPVLVATLEGVWLRHPPPYPYLTWDWTGARDPNWHDTWWMDLEVRGTPHWHDTWWMVLDLQCRPLVVMQEDCVVDKIFYDGCRPTNYSSISWDLAEYRSTHKGSANGIWSLYWQNKTA